MAYWDVSLLSMDSDFAQRCLACYATETAGVANAVDPTTWWSAHSWNMVAMPGFGDAYASALAGDVANPGRDPSVISDGQILSAVQSILSQST